MALGGHVFVVNSDIRQIQCDAVIIPKSNSAERDYWFVHEFPAYSKLPASQRAQIETMHNNGITSYSISSCLHTIFEMAAGITSVESLKELLHPTLQFIGAALKNNKPKLKRANCLITLPSFWHEDRISVEFFESLFDVLLQFTADFGMDAVLVCNERSSFVLAQSIRNKSIQSKENRFFASIGADQLESYSVCAIELRNLLKLGKLVLLIGDRMGGMGNTNWDHILRELAQKLLIDTDHPHWKNLSRQLKAQYIQKRCNGTDFQADAANLRVKYQHFTLLHAILACLPCKEVITTSVDQNFERASNEAHSKPISVIPYNPNPNTDRWILKLHGCLSKPDSIVVTRQDYLRFMDNNAAFAGIAQTALLTSKLLFVGFSLQEENFLKIMDSVRKVSGTTRNIGTYLQLFSNPLIEELWRKELRFISVVDNAASGVTGITNSSYIKKISKVEAFRLQEIFLDVLGLYSSAKVDSFHLLDDRFTKILSDEELQAKQYLLQFVANLSPEVIGAPCFQIAKNMLHHLGLDTRLSSDEIFQENNEVEAPTPATTVGTILGNATLENLPARNKKRKKKKKKSKSKHKNRDGSKKKKHKK